MTPKTKYMYSLPKNQSQPIFFGFGLLHLQRLNNGKNFFFGNKYFVTSTSTSTVLKVQIPIQSL